MLLSKNISATASRSESDSMNFRAPRFASSSGRPCMLPDLSKTKVMSVARFVSRQTASSFSSVGASGTSSSVWGCLGSAPCAA